MANMQDSIAKMKQQLEQNEAAKMAPVMPEPVAAPAPVVAPVEAPKAQGMSLETKQLLGQAILGLAPILAGAALGGARGGAIGSEAGMMGLQRFQQSKEAAEAKELAKQKLASEQSLKNIELALKLRGEGLKQSQEERLTRAEERRATAAERSAEQEAKRLSLQEARDRKNDFIALQKLGLDKQDLARKEKESEQKAAVEKQLPAGQYAAGTYARRVEQAQIVFDELESQGYDRASLKESVKSMLPGRVQDNALKAQTQAERNFVNAVLRRESGAAIAPSEFASAEEQYFPRSGDSPDVLAQKKANRLQVLAGLKAEAGKALEKIPLVSVQAPRVKQSRMGVTEAVAAPPMPDFSSMSEEQLKQYLGQ